MAYTQPEGWRRDVGMAFTAPLVDIAGVLRLDQPREGLKEVLGRGEDDRIATTVVLPPPSTDLAPGGRPRRAGGHDRGRRRQRAPARRRVDGRRRDRGAAKPKPVFTPERPMRLWIAGDSLSIVPGEALLRLTAGNDAVEPVGADKGVEGRLATGLERPDRYDWFTRIQKEMKGKDNPDAVVLTFGSNDIGGYMEGLPEGEEKAAFGTPDWIDQYRERVGGVMDMVIGNGKRNPPRLLVWIGVPIVNDEDRNESYKTRQRDRPRRGGAPRAVRRVRRHVPHVPHQGRRLHRSACPTPTGSCRRCAARTACTSSRPAATSSRRP